MSQPASISAGLPAIPAMLRRQWRVYSELGKLRLSALVVMTTAAGFALAVPGAAPRLDYEGDWTTGCNWAAAGWAVLGTAMCAWAACAMNQIVEARRDGRMPRTKRRPLPSGRIGTLHAVTAAVLVGGLGVSILGAFVNGLTAALGLATILLYVLVYTPMKPRTTMNTLVGSVVGAIPPLMGWTAARGQIDLGAWALVGVLFVWQVPHFLALAWMFRKDYELGGYKMLPLFDASGRLTSRVVLMWCLALIPVGLCGTFLGVSGWTYGVGSVVLGVWLVRLSWRLYREPSDAAARKLFLASVIYLPLLMGLMVLDRPGGMVVPIPLQPTVTATPPTSAGATPQSPTPNLSR